MIVLPAAIVTVLIFLVLGGKTDYVVKDLSYNIFKVLPYLVVLIGALAGINVFIILISGTVLSLIVGLATGAFGAAEMFVHVGDGIMGMYDITVISMIVACIVALVKEYGNRFCTVFYKKTNQQRKRRGTGDCRSVPAGRYVYGQ